MSKRKIWFTPSLHIEEDLGHHRKVTWLELFFDLFFVVVIARLAHDLAHHLSLHALLEFILLFIPVWWMWIGYTYYNERFDTEGLDSRVFSFLLMLPTAGLAVFAENAITTNFSGFVLSYAAGRVIVNFLWIRAGIHEKKFRNVAVKYGIGFTLGNVLAITAAFVESDLRYAVFGAALLADISIPFFTLKDMAVLPRFTTSRLPERFGLFIIIVLGETLVGTITGLSEIKYPAIIDYVTGAFGILIGFSLWWLYFDFIARRAPRQHVVIYWSYSHLPLLMSIVVAGAAILNMFTEDQINQSTKYVGVAIAVFLIFLGIIESTLVRDKDEPTHPYWTFFIKIISGTVLFIVALLFVTNNQLINLLIISLFLLINMIYGLYVWYTQEIE